MTHREPETESQVSLGEVLSELYELQDLAARNEQDLGRVLEELRDFHRQYDRLERLLTRLSDEWVS
jgi:hypothetical protein